MKLRRRVNWNLKNSKQKVKLKKRFFSMKIFGLTKKFPPKFQNYVEENLTKKLKFGIQIRSKGSSNLSVGAQTLWSCSTHQFYNFWKFHQKIFIFSEVMDDFRFCPQSHLYRWQLICIHYSRCDWGQNRKSFITSLKMNIFWWNFQKL